MFRSYKTTEPLTPPMDKVWFWYDDADEIWKYKLDDGSVHEMAGGGMKPANTMLTPLALDGLTGITPSGSQREILYIESDGGVVVNTVNPQIAAGTVHGQEILLVGTSDTDMIRLDQANGLHLNGDCVMRDGSTLLLFWDQFTWLEISRNDI